MGITPRFTSADFNNALARRIAAIELAIENRLKYLGEICLIEMRTNKGYMDQTGNLTSSMGYIVVIRGRIATSAGFDGKAAGSATGHSFASSLASKHPNGYALYVVAGMNYAAYVEAKGRNVITSAEILAERQLPIMLAQLKANIGRT